jgi:tRNA(Ile)-lysidine synthetase-like protein
MTIKDYQHLKLDKGSEVTVCFRNAHGRSLKKRFQEQEIPPWQRATMPLIYYQKKIFAMIVPSCEGINRVILL